MQLKFEQHFGPSNQFLVRPGADVSPGDRFVRSNDKLFLIVKPGGKFAVDVTVLPQAGSIMAFPVMLHTPKGKIYNIYFNGPNKLDACDSASMMEVLPGTTGSIKELTTGPVDRRAYQPFKVIEGGPYGALLSAGNQYFSQLGIYYRLHREISSRPVTTSDQYRRGLAYGPAKLAGHVWVMSEQHLDKTMNEYAGHRPQ